jgi:hypothetical protein
MSQEPRLRFAVETLGLVAVVVSLAFVGMEIRQNTTAVRSATTQAVADQAMELTLAMATDEHLPGLVANALGGGLTQAELNPEDNMRLVLAVTAGLRRQENLYQQVQAGVLDASALDNVSFGFYRNAFVRELWLANRQFFDDAFAEYWDVILAEDG